MTKDYKDNKDDFDTWCDMWDAACEKGIFPQTPKLDPLPESDDDFDDDYYRNIDREAAEEGLLQESSSDSANPIFPDSVGKDSLIKTKTSLVDEKPIEVVADLKRKLYDIECKLNAKDAGGSKWHEGPVEVNDQTLWKQIRSLQQKIDTLSNNLGFKDDPSTSLYRTK